MIIFQDRADLAANRVNAGAVVETLRDGVSETNGGGVVQGDRPTAPDL